MKMIGELIPQSQREKGCGKCEFGLLSAPVNLAAMTLVEQRTLQATQGEISFCDCEMGQSYRRHLRKQYRYMIEDDPYYCHPVIDADTREPMIGEDGNAIPWFNAATIQVVNESSEAAAVRFRAMNESE
jgi:hypothetical protein